MNIAPISLGNLIAVSGAKIHAELRTSATSDCELLLVFNESSGRRADFRLTTVFSAVIRGGDLFEIHDGFDGTTGTRISMAEMARIAGLAMRAVPVSVGTIDIAVHLTPTDPSMPF